MLVSADAKYGRIGWWRRGESIGGSLVGLLFLFPLLLVWMRWTGFGCWGHVGGGDGGRGYEGELRGRRRRLGDCHHGLCRGT